MHAVLDAVYNHDLNIMRLPLVGRVGLWADDLLWEPCLRCSWTYPGKSVYWIRGMTCSSVNTTFRNAGVLIQKFLKSQYLHLAFTKIYEYLPVPRFGFFMVSWSHSLACNSAQLSCEMLSVTHEAEMPLCGVWPPPPRLMYGVWEYCCSLCSVDTCPLMMTTAWSSTGRLQ